MCFITVFIICQIYNSQFIHENSKIQFCKYLPIYSWLKAILRKLLCCGCFPGNFPQYLRSALPSESYTSRWLLWIELSTIKIIGQGHYCIIPLYNGMEKLFKIDHLPYSSERKLCYSRLFLKKWDFRKKLQQKIVKQ